MIPAWIWSILVITVGCIAALWLGSSLPEQGIDPMHQLGTVCFLAVGVLCVIYGDFPFLLALGTWIPFFPHPVFTSMPTGVYFMIWMSGILFFRLCVNGYLRYRQSFNWFLLFVFAWAPIRFLLSPVTKFGATAGGSGVSGLTPYIGYFFAAATLVFMGAVLYDRAKIMYFMRWCYIIVLLSGISLTICAFVPATGPILVAMGSYPAGDMGDGIQRLVQLPGYGLFLLEVSLCPGLFHLKRWQSVLIFVLGFLMIVVGGNRSAFAGAIIFAPIILFLRRQTHTMAIMIFLMVGCLLVMRVYVESTDATRIPMLLRCFGVFDSKIEKATGGDVSAEGRYEVWRDAWKKIIQKPLGGYGFGNLPQHIEGTDVAKSKDFEVVLAGGEAHNGFVTAAYGFGLPFMLALSAAIVLYFFKESTLALRTDPHDPELRDLHAFLAGMFATYPILIYTAFDLSMSFLWCYAALSSILTHLPRQDINRGAEAGPPLRKYGEEPRPAGQYYYRPR